MSAPVKLLVALTALLLTACGGSTYRRPRDAADQALQEIVKQLGAAHSILRQPNSTWAQFDSKLDPVINQWFERVVVPKLAAAIANYTLSDDAVANALDWARFVELFGGTDRHASQVARMWADIQKLIEAVHKGLVERCIKGHDISAVVPLIGLIAQRELLGPGIVFTPFPEEVRKCLRFELDFETVTPFLTDDAYQLHTRVIHMVLEPDAAGKITGSQAHEIVGSIDPHGTHRRFEHVASSRPFKVLSLGFKLHFLLRPTAKEAKNAVTGVSLTIDPGEVTGDEVDTVFGGTAVNNAPMIRCFYLPEAKAHQCWTARHFKDAVEPGPRPSTFEIHLEPNIGSGSSLLARKTFQLPCDYSSPSGLSFDCGTELTTVDLRHAPAG